MNSTVGGMGGRKPNLVLCWSPHSGDEALLEIRREAREGPHQSIHGACGQVSRYVLCPEATDRIEAKCIRKKKKKKRITAPAWRLRPRKHGRGEVGRLWVVTHTLVTMHIVHGPRSLLVKRGGYGGEGHNKGHAASYVPSPWPPSPAGTSPPSRPCTAPSWPLRSRASGSPGRPLAETAAAPRTS